MRNGNAIEMSGKRFGMLTVLSRAPNDKNGSAMWLCSCDCGGGAIVKGVSLRGGARTSCGRHATEAQRAVDRATRTTHGMDGTPEYRAWINMRERCNKPAHKAYISYGGRGITVCDRWNSSFENFFADMGVRPSAAHSIEREDVNGNYEPDNCHWATNLEQGRNTRRTLYVEVDGVVSTLSEAAAQMGISNSALNHRARRGWPGIKLVPAQKPTPMYRSSPYHIHLLIQFA